MLKCVLKKRRESQKVATLLIQRYLKGHVARKAVKAELIMIKEVRLVKAIEMRIKRSNKTDRERFEQAAQKIQRSIYGKIVRKRESKQLREELRKLPFICRSSFLKMHLLKKNTSSLRMEVNTTFSYF